MMLRTGDPAPGVNGLLPSPLTVFPLAATVGVDIELLYQYREDELVTALGVFIPATLALRSIFLAILTWAGGIVMLVQKYREATIAILAGASLAVIWQKLNAGEPIDARKLVGDGNGGNGGNGQIIPPDYGIGGPGIPEPRAGTFQKMWRIPWERRDGTNGYTWFWHMNDGFIISYTKPPGKWNRWKPVKPIAVLGRKMSLNTFLKADRYLDRFARRIAKRSSKLQLQRRGK